MFDLQETESLSGSAKGRDPSIYLRPNLDRSAEDRNVSSFDPPETDFVRSAGDRSLLGSAEGRDPSVCWKPTFDRSVRDRSAPSARDRNIALLESDPSIP